MSGWVWLSFADSELPKGQQFLGVCIVQGSGVLTGAQRAWELGINPGGEVACFELPEGAVPDPRYTDRLLGREEAESLGAMDPDDWLEWGTP